MRANCIYAKLNDRIPEWDLARAKEMSQFEVDWEQEIKDMIWGDETQWKNSMKEYHNDFGQVSESVKPRLVQEGATPQTSKSEDKNKILHALSRAIKPFREAWVGQ